MTEKEKEAAPETETPRQPEEVVMLGPGALLVLNAR